jgi:hypothetical protein
MKLCYRLKTASFSLIMQLLLAPLSALAGNAAYQLAFTTQPAGSSIGASLGSVVVQLADKSGSNVLSSGTVIKISLNKAGGFGGVTNAATDANGKATFTGLKVNLPGNNYSLLATASGLVGATSHTFNVVKGSATVTVTSSTNNLIYGQSITLTAAVKAVAPATDALTGTITFKDGAVTLGSATLNAAGQAAFSAKILTATNLKHTITAIFGGSANYSNSMSANFVQSVSKLVLSVSGITASNKVYDGSTSATLNLSKATLKTVLAEDAVTLNTSAAKGAFASKTVGTGKTVTVSGLVIAGTSAANYTLAQPTATANITVRNLSVTATGVNKVYDGTTAATVTLADNHVAGDSLADGYTNAVFANKNTGTNISITVSGLMIAGADAANYVLTSTNTKTTANITPATLTVSAGNLSRPYATTNPPLVAAYSGFVPGESKTNSDLHGSPMLATPATTNSAAGSYPITISKGTLVSTNYSLFFSNGTLTVTHAATAAQLTTTINPALTNQNITFTAKVTPLVTTMLPPSGTVQFKCNGTNKLGNAVSLTGGQAILTALAGSLGKGNVVITAEYSDPSGNFNASSNVLSQTIVSPTPPPPCKMSLAPAFSSGKVTATLSGTAGTTYVIQASTDFVHWTAISTNIADANGAVSLVDSNAAAYPSRFYRAYSP